MSSSQVCLKDYPRTALSSNCGAGSSSTLQPTRSGPESVHSLQVTRMGALEEAPTSVRSAVGLQVGIMVVETLATRPLGLPVELPWVSGRALGPAKVTQAKLKGIQSRTRLEGPPNTPLMLWTVRNNGRRQELK